MKYASLFKFGINFVSPAAPPEGVRPISPLAPSGALLLLEARWPFRRGFVDTSAEFLFSCTQDSGASILALIRLFQTYGYTARTSGALGIEPAPGSAPINCAPREQRTTYSNFDFYLRRADLRTGKGSRFARISTFGSTITSMYAQLQACAMARCRLATAQPIAVTG
ncbi:unnamed protein product, partial [Iphiclides podalirius]